MHLALYANNAANRKQLERLLQRESDKISSQYGVLYVDSFGSFENMLHNPRQYDGFLLDLDKNEPFPEDTIDKLHTQGVLAPIVVCAGDLSSFPALEEDSRIFYLSSPVNQETISQTIKQIRSIKDSAQPLIEFRVEEQTHYVTEPEILYALSVKDGIEIHLTKNRTLMIQNNISNLFSEISMYESFFAPSQKVILNGRHIQDLKGLKAVMSDGASFKVSLSCLSYAKYAFRKFHETTN